MKLQDYQELAVKWNKLVHDIDRLQFLKDNKGRMIAILDNDNTTVHFSGYESLPEHERDIIDGIGLKSFDDYHYWSDGCLLLFKFAGIDAESC